MSRQTPERIPVAVVGASGYTGGELVRLLLQHPIFQVTVATSEQSAGKRLDALFPNLRGRANTVLQRFDPKQLAGTPAVFVAVPHGEAMEIVARLDSGQHKIVDLSADFRLRSAAAYEQWYRRDHTAPQLLSGAVYGLPELYRDRIRNARLVANPGCYPTGALLALIPLLKHDLIDPQSIIIDSKSGVSGAGRTPGPAYHFPETNEALTAYGAGRHRHRAEIEQEIGGLCGHSAIVTFTPHLIPVTRGIYTTLYARLRDPSRSAVELLDRFRTSYAHEPFIRILETEETPNLHAIRGSNDCHIGLLADAATGVVTVFSAIDNLVKGAAGQALQNMNLMLGLEEASGLTGAGLFP